MKSILKKVGILLVLLMFIALPIIYFGSYSQGTQAGVVMKISKKGVIFKTWEGRLDMGTMGRVADSNLGTKIYEFSIDGSNEELLKQLHDVQLSGVRVNIFFDQKYIAVPWRGETKFFVTKIESSGEVPEKHNILQM